MNRILLFYSTKFFGIGFLEGKKKTKSNMHNVILLTFAGWLG